MCIRDRSIFAKTVSSSKVLETPSTVTSPNSELTSISFKDNARNLKAEGVAISFKSCSLRFIVRYP